MTEILKLAKELGVVVPKGPSFDDDILVFTVAKLRSFYAQGVRDGMERAAKLCEAVEDCCTFVTDRRGEEASQACAAAIRTEAAKTAAGEDR